MTACRVNEPLDKVLFTDKIQGFYDKGITNFWEAAFLIQTEQWMDQTQNLGDCNIQIYNLNQWYKLYLEMNDEDFRGDTH